MTVKNYYSLTAKELDSSILEIREWMFSFPKHPQFEKAWFALEVALCAKEIERDEFINLLIDNL
jgi:hypothetical protein